MFSSVATQNVFKNAVLTARNKLATVTTGKYEKFKVELIIFKFRKRTRYIYVKKRNLLLESIQNSLQFSTFYSGVSKPAM